MIKTHNLTGKEPLDKLLNGSKILYDAVSTTMGPRGNNVIFKKAGRKVGVTHDGVTVAKAVHIDDPTLDVGAELLREAAAKLDATTGDGTTTVTVLTYHLLENAATLIKQGHNPMKLRLALEKLQDQVVSSIKQVAKTDVSVEDVVAVAKIAAGNQEIGETVGKAVFEAGKDTPFVLNLSEGPETTIESINGFKIDAGPASPYLLEGAGLSLTIDNPFVVVCDAKLRSKEDILPILKTIASLQPEDKRLLLVCQEVASDALNLLVVNHLKGFAQIAVCRVPAYISSPSEYLQDLAVSCGARVLSRNTGHTISDPLVEDFGRAEKVIVELGQTIIVNGQPVKREYDKHLEGLKAFKAKNPAEKKFIKDRVSTLQQQVVSIRVGGQSETDAEERLYRFEDAVGASRAALRHGVVPGGGTLLYSIAKDLMDPVLSPALTAPLKIVYKNAGIEPEVGKVGEYLVFNDIEVGKGYDVMNPSDGIIDLVERGILDPAESEIECVKTAITIAGLLMTSGAMIIDEEIKNETQTELGFSGSQPA